ncbi:MAG: hypothetical protein IPQ18_00225 [Saprospiraceae bacterium]|nr:hypothetical protein [Saprospiraceae bacterium]
MEQLSACVVGGVTAADCPVPLGCNSQTYTWGSNIYVPPGSSVTIQYTAKVVDDSQPIQVVNTAKRI